MTTEQKSRIAILRAAGLGYATIAKELGVPKSTISSYCQKNHLISASNRGNTVTLTFASEPDEAAMAEALMNLMNVR